MEALLEFFDPCESSPTRDPLPNSLPPEVEQGNVEYKLKLLNPSASRFEHLVTQMKWRLREGQGEAIYQIGVADSGALRGLSETEMEHSLDTLSKMAEKLGATVSNLRQRVVFEGGEGGVRRSVMEMLVRKVPDDQQFLDQRLAVLGPVEGGKSTLLGVLTQGELDNGRGRARLNLFRHLHEIQSGRTSSISHEILGFSATGEVVNYSTCVSVEEICEASSKLITFIDLAGHQKYMKTTIFGLTAHCPDFAMLVVGANSGVVGTTCEHLGFSMALSMPTFVVVTKTDLCSESQVDHTVHQLEELLSSPGCCKIPYTIRSASDAYTAAQNFSDNSIAPIFRVSCVTGENLDLLRKFLNTVPPLGSRRKDQPKLEQQLTEFQVDEIYNVPEAGTVLGGVLTSGVIREGDGILVGPKEDGGFTETAVATIRRNRTPCKMVRAGQTATVTLTQVEKADIRKGIVLLSPLVALGDQCGSCWEFEAEVFMLYVTGTVMKPGFQATVYVASTMQTAAIEETTGNNGKDLGAGEKGRVHFRFQRHPEFLRVGSRVLFREGRTKGIGEIVRLIHSCEGATSVHEEINHSQKPERRKHYTSK